MRRSGARSTPVGIASIPVIRGVTNLEHPRSSLVTHAGPGLCEARRDPGIDTRETT
jgi:hypothetical protein